MILLQITPAYIRNSMDFRTRCDTIITIKVQQESNTLMFFFDIKPWFLKGGRVNMQKAISILHNLQVIRGMEHIPETDEVPAVILLHGFTGSKLEPHRFFLKISRELEALGIASFRFDFLGSGESDGDFEDMTVLKELAEAKTIFEYVSSHPLVDKEKIFVLGFSMGGLVASLLAGDLKDDVYKLILLAPAGNMLEEAKIMEQNSTFIEAKNAFDIGGNLIGKGFIEELKTVKVWDWAAKYQKQVLLIHGTQDQAVSYTQSLLYKENCYKDIAEINLIDGADHTFNSYKWEKEVINAICAFVK